MYLPNFFSIWKGKMAKKDVYMLCVLKMGHSCQIIQKFGRERWNFIKNYIVLIHRSNTNVFIEDLPQVTEEANSGLCREITLEELRKALQGMEGGRAPGIDGLSVDFYKSFWPDWCRSACSHQQKSKQWKITTELL